MSRSISGSASSSSASSDVDRGHQLYAVCWGAAAVSWAILGARALARRHRECGGRARPGAVATLLVATVAAAFAGAKLHFLLASSGLTALTFAGPDHRGVVESIIGPGLRISGGLLAGGLTLVPLGPRLLGRRLRAPAILDALAPPAGLAIAIGRIGCLAAGCCFGTPTRLPWAIRYSAGSPAYWNHVAQGLITEASDGSLPVHPLPLYLAAAGIAATLTARAAARWMRGEGRAALGFALALSALRLAIEPLRETRFVGEIAGQRTLDAAIVVAAALALACQLVLRRSERS